MIDLKKTSTILGIITVLGGAAVWAADQRYVTVSSLSSALNQQEIKTISEKIDELTLKKEVQGLTPLEKANLKRLEDKRKQLQGK